MDATWDLLLAPPNVARRGAVDTSNFSPPASSGVDLSRYFGYSSVENLANVLIEFLSTSVSNCGVLVPSSRLAAWVRSHLQQLISPSNSAPAIPLNSPSAPFPLADLVAFTNLEGSVCDRGAGYGKLWMGLKEEAGLRTETGGNVHAVLMCINQILLRAALCILQETLIQPAAPMVNIHRLAPLLEGLMDDSRNFSMERVVLFAAEVLGVAEAPGLMVEMAKRLIETWVGHRTANTLADVPSPAREALENDVFGAIGASLQILRYLAAAGAQAELSSNEGMCILFRLELCLLLCGMGNLYR